MTQILTYYKVFKEMLNICNTAPLNWVIPEKIHTPPPPPDGWHAGNSRGRGGFGPKKSSSGVIFTLIF